VLGIWGARHQPCRTSEVPNGNRALQLGEGKWLGRRRCRLIHGHKPDGLATTPSQGRAAAGALLATERPTEPMSGCVGTRERGTSHAAVAAGLLDRARRRLLWSGGAVHASSTSGVCVGGESGKQEAG
jgi:hypothetical protein